MPPRACPAILPRELTKASPASATQQQFIWQDTTAVITPSYQAVIITYALFQSICVYLFYQPFGRSVASRLSPFVIGINLQNPLKKGSRVASYLVTFIPNHHSRFPHMTGLGHQEVPSWSKATKLIFAWLIPKRGVCFTLGPKVKAVSGEVRFYDCAF